MDLTFRKLSSQQNRAYLYNFLYDNCSTRVRDIIEKSTDNRDHVESTGTGHEKFLESSGRIPAIVRPWTQWGIHTILGSPGQLPTPRTGSRCFLPDYLMYALRLGSIIPTELRLCPADRNPLPGTGTGSCDPLVLLSPFFVFCHRHGSIDFTSTKKPKELAVLRKAIVRTHSLW